MDELCQDVHPQPAEPVPLLLVSHLEVDRILLRRILGRSNWKLRESTGCREALAFLQDHLAPVAICEWETPDGNWQVILDGTAGLPNPPNIIVYSRIADNRLWSEVLERGGYDLLPAPFEPGEVFPMVFLAWLSWKRRWERTVQEIVTEN